MLNENERKTEQFTIRLTKKEYSAFTTLCHKKEMPRAHVAYKLLMDYMSKEKSKK